MNQFVSRSRGIAVAAVLAAAFLLLLFRHHDIHGENYYYWYFARVLTETGEFPVFDRSPLSALYLSVFYWLGYPANVIAEYVVRLILVQAAFIYLFRPHVGLAISILIGLAWITFLEDAAPFGQALGLACVMVAVGMRTSGDAAWRVGVSYALLLLAYLFRLNYAVFILLFAGLDVWRLAHRGWSGLSRRSFYAAALPMVAVSLLVAWFWFAQWGDPLNNVYIASGEWFPIRNMKSLGDANFVHAFSYLRIMAEYGTHFDRDWYFESPKLLGGAQTLREMLALNAHFVIDEFNRNIPVFLRTILTFTLIPRATSLDNLSFISSVLLCALLFGGALVQAFKMHPERPFLVLLVIGAAVTALPKLMAIAEGQRHYAGLVPAFVFAGLWLGNQIERGLLNRGRLEWAGALFIALAASFYLADKSLGWLAGTRSFPTLAMAAGAATALAWAALRWGPDWLDDGARKAAPLSVGAGILFCAAPVVDWAAAVRDVAGDLRQGKLALMERPAPEFSPKRLMREIGPELMHCRGLMGFDHLYYAAFSHIPRANIHDIFEIPPFGHLGASPYDGLRPDRVDCIAISEALSTVEGAAVNVGMRYRNYIRPYADQLVAMGGKKVEIEGYGIVILPPPRVGS